MSSTLQSQLASLHGATSSTKRHEEAIGRGIHHSVNVGYTVSTSTSAKFKPSILYPDARAAADISVATIREDSVAALHQLEQFTGNNQFVTKDFLQGLLGPQSLQVERRKLTKGEWDIIFNQISSLLYILATAHGNNSTTTTCVLRVLEYLIRRYDIHATKETAHLLLLTTLPQHESSFFTRILQLVDLHSLPLWNWLRPYAATGAPPLSRSAVASRASKDDALLVQLLQLAKDIATVSTTTQSSSSSSRILSFVGATVAEALSKQATTGNQGSMISEQTVRNILPYILSACGGDDVSTSDKPQQQLFLKCPEWRNLGFILTTILSENCTLGYAAREVIAVTMAKGSLLLDTGVYQEDNINHDYDNEALEAATDTLLAISAFLIPNTYKYYSVNENNDFVGVRLLKTSTSKVQKGNTAAAATENDTVIGCELPKSTYLALCRHRLLASAFSNAVEGRNIDVTTLMAAFIGRALSYLSNEKDGKRLGSQIIQSLAKEEGLQRVWQAGKQHILAASVAAEIITLFAKSSSLSNLEYFKDALVAIYRASRVGCDLGVATTVSSWDVNDVQGKEQIRELLRNAFGSEVVLNEEETAVESCSNKTETSSAAEWIDFVPPRMALEHPDASVRKKSIQKLVNQYRLEPSRQTGEDDYRIASALLRRAAVDDDVQVAIAAMSAFSLLVKENLIMYVPSAEEAISVVCQWSLVRKVPKQKKRGTKQRGKEKSTDPSFLTNHDINVTCCAIELCSMASKAPLSKSDLHFLIQCITLHSEIDELKEEFDTSLHDIPSELKGKLQNTIHDALIDVLSYGTGEEASSENSIANILATSSICQDTLRSIVLHSCKDTDHLSVEKKSISEIHDRFVRIMISSFNSVIKSGSFNFKHMAFSVMQSSFLFMVDRKKLCDVETDSLLRCIKTYIKSSSFLEGISLFGSEGAINFVDKLASVGSPETFKNISVPAIEDLRLAHCRVWSDTVPNLLLEVCTIPSTRDESITRLLQLVRENLASLTFNSGELVLVLSLLSHRNRMVRKGVLELLEAVVTEEALGKDFVLVSNIATSNEKAKLELGGENALIDFLKECVMKSSPSNHIRNCLMNQCVLCTVGKNGTRYKLHPKRMSVGSLTAASILLNAMEDAGDSFFSLEERWKFCGKLIFEMLIGVDSGDSIEVLQQPLVDSVVRMLKGVIINDIKPVHMVTGPSGRSRSYSVGNTDDLAWLKPYPVSMCKSIIDCFTNCLSFGRMTYIARSTIRLVLGRQSWTNHIFANLTDKTRRQIVLSLMQIKEVLDDQEASFALFELPLTADDFTILLRTIEDSPSTFQSKLISFTQLSECIARKAQNLERVKLVDLARILFQLLTTLSAESSKDNDELDIGLGYTRLSILRTLNFLCGEYRAFQENQVLPSSSARRRSRSRSSSFSYNEKDTHLPSLTSFAELLVGLLGRATSLKGAQGIHPLESTQSRSIAVSLLSILCAMDPGSSSDCLSQALVNLVSSGSEKNMSDDYLDLVSNVTKVIIDLADASAFSSVSLYRSFAWTCNKSSLPPLMKERVYESFIGPLSNLPEELHVGKSIASLLAVSLAVSVFCSAMGEYAISGKHVSEIDKDALSVKFCMRALHKMPSSHQIYTNFELLRYAGSLMDILSRSTSSSSHEETHDETQSNATIFYVTCNDLMNVALGGSDESYASNAGKEYSVNEARCIMLLTTAILTMVRDGLSSPMAKKVIQRSEQGAELCLGVWRELVQLQVASHGSKHSARTVAEKEFWIAAPTTIHNCLATLQKMLPVPYFLASVLTLLREEDADAKARKYALSLLAERSAEVDPESSEFMLFLEVIPELVELCRCGVVNVEEVFHDSRRKVVLQQSALMAIECLVKSLFPTGRKLPRTKKETAILLETLGNTSNISLESAQKFSKAFKENIRYTDDGYIFSSAILCSATLLSLLQVSALPHLKSMVTVIIQSLQSINILKKSNAEENRTSASETKESLEVLDLMHCSAVKGLIASVEALPQFFNPFLIDLLQPDAVPSLSMQRDSFKTEAMKQLIERLHQSLATKIPARQLLPAMHASITKSIRASEKSIWEEIQSVIQLMAVCLRATTRTDLTAIMSKALGSLMVTYAYSGEQDERYPLLQTCNEALLALVLKISESQLHSLYSKMREWRGEVDFSNLTIVSASKRYAFWSITATLAKELRSLFLPCMSSVVLDIVCELENSASKLSSTLALKKSKNGKRQKLSISKDANVTYDNEQVRPLQQILLSLEYAMKSDAHDGGGWSRADEGQRFHLLLSPMGKLLQAEVPTDLPLRTDPSNNSKTSSAFDRLVSGVDTSECGNVVGCLTAMAVAAGNEQLWKPLNHAVLQACGNDDRPEVRRVGVMTLLSLMKTIGEEYMVLLPECLPVLSELLEDENEEISTMAKECISLGEELLGENLEDSLR